MNNFWQLVAFEYRKIFSKRTVVIYFLVAILISVSASGIVIGDVYVDGEVVDSKYNNYLIDKNYSLALAGRVVDAELLGEVVEAYAKYPNSATIEEQREAVENYIRPYLDVKSIINYIYGAYEYAEIASLTDEQLDDFYEIRAERIYEYIDSVPINDRSKALLLEMSNDIQTPIIMGYADSYLLSMAMMDSSALVLSFFIAFIFAGMFAKEYQTGIIAIQLTAKNGRKTLFFAKIFTFITAASLVILSILAVNFITCMAIYGTEGAQTALQNHLVMSPYPFTVFEATMVDYLVIFIASLFFGTIIVFLSSFSKSPFIVLAIGMAILLIPIFLPVPETLPTLYKLMGLFPTNGFLYLNNFSVLVYELGFISAPPYIFVPIFHLAASILLLFISSKLYKNHQVI